MNDNDGCASAFAGFGLGALIAVACFVWLVAPHIEAEANEWGIKRGRAMQFCVDHGGQWDNANVRCLKAADTITVQVPK